MSSFVHARSFTVFPAIYVLPAANFVNESEAILIRKTRLAFKMTLVDNRAGDARPPDEHIGKPPIASVRRTAGIRYRNVWPRQRLVMEVNVLPTA
jgi:hypothetical protein